MIEITQLKIRRKKMTILKRFKDTGFILVVHTNGFELFSLKENPQHCGDYDYDHPFEYWETENGEVADNG